LVVPNSRIWGDVIRNVTSQKFRRVDLSFGLAHDTEVRAVDA
jgi:small conductance mechanosensitive channel